eukprot:Selendium_serpulae@DN6252_c0_g2_i1.p1
MRWSDNGRLGVKLEESDGDPYFRPTYFQLRAMSQEAKQKMVEHGSGGDIATSKDYLLRTGNYDQIIRLQFVKVVEGWTSLRNMHNNNNIGIDKHNTKKLNTNKTDNSGSMVEWQILAVLNNPGDEVHAIDADSPPRDAWKPVGEYIML